MDRLSDLPGLFNYLAAKVCQGYTCVACNAQFHSLGAVRHHMAAKAHYHLFDMDEFTEFYADDEQNDEEVGQLSVDPITSELHITRADGSVKRLGHRALARYYRQRFVDAAELAAERRCKEPSSLMASVTPAEEMLAERRIQLRQESGRSLVSEPRARSWAGPGVKVDHVELKRLAAAQRRNMRHKLRLGVQANTLNPHVIRWQFIFD
eukprot:gnl/Ergobibamus_cyprinoides/511.p1 GENE.gnl/Ergobibamus_cyprinoides/511~~gnl/Ergobibamus_cyprinoides/511.p1  ORF type:complete len:208 (+),score=78.65 gnl/Ergobibamus_cyprinoides/511:762-1385(+)